MHILTVNCGSSSVRIDIIDHDPGGRDIGLVNLHVRNLGDSPAAEMRAAGESAEPFRVGPGGYREIATAALVQLKSRGLLAGVAGAGHRVVHGGPKLTEPVLISDESLAAIEAAAELAPLHNGPALDAIKAAREVLPHMAQVATFDTGFFRDLPAAASTYAIPAEIAASLGIRRYGFHGLAHRYMATRFAALAAQPRSRLVTLQLGGGCSATALRDGRPVDTSMGFTPLEGLVMATRSGDIDPSLPLHLAERTGAGIGAVRSMLNDRSGLAGLSGGESDMSRLLEREAAGDTRASLAIEVFCYRVRKYIGAYAAILGGLDGLAFGGGIGENSAEVRSRICSGFEWLGLELDPEANRSGRGPERAISTADSRVEVWVIAVDEASVIAADTAACIGEDCGQHDSRG